MLRLEAPVTTIMHYTTYAFCIETHRMSVLSDIWLVNDKVRTYVFANARNRRDTSQQDVLQYQIGQHSNMLARSPIVRRQFRRPAFSAVRWGFVKRNACSSRHVYWFQLARDGLQWQDTANMVMNLPEFHSYRKAYCPTEIKSNPNMMKTCYSNNRHMSTLNVRYLCN